jgi:hypothetical protein
MEYAKETAGDYVPAGQRSTTFAEAISRDPIATVRSLVRGVCTRILKSQLPTDFKCRSMHHRSGDNIFQMS